MLTNNINAIDTAGNLVDTSTVKGSKSFHDVILYLLIALAILFIILLFIVLYQNNKISRLWKGNRKNRIKNSSRFYTSIYRFLTSNPLTRNYIEKLSYRYRLISPCDSKTIAKKTVLTCLVSWSICILTFVYVYLSSQRIITLIIMAFAIVIVNSEVIGRMAKMFEITVHDELQNMIANVEHYFYVEYRVDDAIYRAREGLSPIMKAASDQVYQLLLSDDKSEALREYYVNIPNKYLRAFVSQCVGVMERGDKEIDGELLFIRNLQNLQREIDIEKEKLQRLSMEFLGVILCVIAPIFCIDFVKQFAINMKENMESFFYGKEGFLLDICLLILISCIYIIMRKSAEYTTFHLKNLRWLFTIDRIPLIKKAMDNYCDKNASKLERLKRNLRNNGYNIRARHFILRSYLIATFVFAAGIGITFYLHDLSREQLLTADISDVKLLTSAAKENQYEAMGEVIEKYTRQYVMKVRTAPKKRAVTKEETVTETKEEMLNILSKDGTFYNRFIIDALADEILLRVDKYKKEYFSFIDLAICLLISVIMYSIPWMMLKYSSAISKDAMEDEVNQFNALICMLMYIESITVKQILEEMESFAVVFKQSLRTCINDYGTGDLQALKELKEREPYEPFKRLIDNLIRCDSMPVYQAFHEIDVERDGYMSKRKLTNEKSIRKRVFRAYILAAIPFLLLFAYGLIPTLIASMSELNVMIRELESMSW